MRRTYYIRVDGRVFLIPPGQVFLLLFWGVDVRVA